MRKCTMSAAILTMAVSSVSFGQTITSTLTENFDDGNGSARWDLVAREPGVDPVTGVPDASAVFNFDYSATTYTNYSTNAQAPVGAAPHGGGTKGALIHVNDNQGSVLATAQIAAANILPKTFTTTGDYKMTVDLFANNSNPNSSGSSEFSLVGLNAGPTAANGGNNLVVGPDQNTGSSPNASANGYAFASSTDGGFAGDYRVYALRLSNDDGPRYQKRNASWTGTASGPIFNTDGTYTGTTTNPEESFNNYYQDLSPGNKNGPFTGGIGKSWVTVGVEQRGNMVAYTLNGKIINTLFTPFTPDTPLTGKPALGAYDGAASVPADTSESYFLYDNVVVNNYAAPTANTIPAGDNYAHFNGGGTVTANGAATINFLQFDTAATTLAGTGTLTLGSPAGAVYATGTGLSHTISKPLAIAADTAVYVDEGSNLTATNVTWGTGVDFHKEGRGTLTLNTIRAHSLNVMSGMLKVPASANKIELINFGYVGATADTARLDIGKSVFAVDYSNAPLTSTPPTTVEALSPFARVGTFINNGFAADGSGNPQWNGPGIVTSAPELQGANFATSNLTIRAIEATTLGYGDGSTWGATGLTIDATTVLFGITFKADTNLDQTINFDDLLKLAQNYNPAFVPNFDQTDPTAADYPRQWYMGDTNADGIVNFDDLLSIAQLYNLSVNSGGSLIGGDAFASDWALAQSMVPEPASLSLLGLGAAAMIRRRRR